MSNKGSSASFIHTKKIAIIFRLSAVIFAFLVILSLISCEGGVYSEKIAELLYTHDYDSVSYDYVNTCGLSNLQMKIYDIKL